MSVSGAVKGRAPAHPPHPMEKKIERERERGGGENIKESGRVDGLTNAYIYLSYTQTSPY